MSIQLTRQGIDRAYRNYIAPLIERSVAGVEFTRGRSQSLIKEFTFNLNVAGEQTINLQGDFVYGFLSSRASDTVSVQFSKKDSIIDSHTLTRGLGFRHPFDKLHIAWDAQETDSYLTVIVCNLAPELFGIIDNRSNVQTVEGLDEIAEFTRLLKYIPEGATEIKAYAELNAINSVNVYTVPAGKTLYIYSSVVNAQPKDPTHTYTVLFDGTNIINSVAFLYGGQSVGGNNTLNHKPAFKVDEGITITLNGYGNGMVATAGRGIGVIHGWLE